MKKKSKSIKSLSSDELLELTKKDRESKLKWCEHVTSIAPEPNRHFNIGDVVRSTMGSSNDTVIDILARNSNNIPTIYELQHDHILSEHHKNIGKPETTTGIYPWIDIYPVYETYPSVVIRNKWNHAQNFNTPISSLLYRYYGSSCDLKRLKMDTEYQRDYVWSLEDKQRLMKSVFEDKDIGTFYLYLYEYDELKDSDYDCEILDGKQRLSTIIEFMQDEFTYNGYLYSQLSSQEHSHLDNRIVNTVEIHGPLTLKEKMEYFLYINDTGVPQLPEHLEKLKKMIDQL